MATATVKAIAFGSLDELLDAICEKLQLSPPEYQLAEQRYEGVGTYLDRHKLLSPFRPRVYPQGSVALGTTVRPKGRQEHDIDLVCELQIEPAAVTNPLAVLDLVQQSIQESEVYRRLTERKNRCIRLNYVGKFHLDILPACPDLPSGGTCVVVPDCRAQAWKASNPEGYATWFKSRCQVGATAILARAANVPKQEAVAEKAPLKLAVQLAKRARDVQFSGQPRPRSTVNHSNYPFRASLFGRGINLPGRRQYSLGHSAQFAGRRTPCGAKPNERTRGLQRDLERTTPVFCVSEFSAGVQRKLEGTAHGKRNSEHQSDSGKVVRGGCHFGRCPGSGEKSSTRRGHRVLWALRVQAH